MPERNDVTIILSAGKSSRLAHLAFDRPKTLLSVSGQSLMERLCLQFAPMTRAFIVVAGSNREVIETQASELNLPIRVLGDTALSDLGNAASLRAGLTEMQAISEAEERPFSKVHILEADVLLSEEALGTYRSQAEADVCLSIPLCSESDDRIYRDDAGRIGISKSPSGSVKILGKFLGVSCLRFDRAKGLLERIPEASSDPYINYLPWAFLPGLSVRVVAPEQAMEIDTGDDYRGALMNSLLARPVDADSGHYRDVKELSFQGHLKRLVGVHDAFGARMTAHCGFDGLWLGSFQISIAAGGQDDASYDPAEALALAEQLQASGNLLPVVVDIGNGFANETVAEAFVNRAVHASVSALCVEDNDSRLCSLYSDQSRNLISPAAFGERVGNLVSLAAGRLQIIARSEALTVGWAEDEAFAQANERLACAQEAGAAALLPHYVGRESAVIKRYLAQADFDSPVILVPTGLLESPIQSFKEMGCSAVVYANLDLRLRFEHLREAYSRLNTEGALAPDLSRRLADPMQMKALLGD